MCVCVCVLCIKSKIVLFQNIEIVFLWISHFVCVRVFVCVCVCFSQFVTADSVMFLCLISADLS